MAGVYSAIGVGLAFILSITLTPIIYSIHPETGNVLKGTPQPFSQRYGPRS